MSVHLMSEIWDDEYYQQGDKSKLLVALALADYANKEGACWPSIEALSHKSRSSIRSVQEMLRNLEKDGKVVIEVGKGPNRTNRYLLCRTPQPLHPATIAPRKMTPEKPAEILAESLASDCTQTVRNHHEPSGTVKNHHSTVMQEIIDSWNLMGDPFPQVQAITDKRKKAINSRISEKFFISNWRQAMDRLKASDFARGGGSTGWVASIDFFLKPDSVAKIMEGRYDNRNGSRMNGNSRNGSDVHPSGPFTVIPTEYTMPRRETHEEDPHQPTITEEGEF